MQSPSINTTGICSQYSLYSSSSWVEKDITEDEELYKEYWEQIPVVLIDGEQHTFWRVDPRGCARRWGRGETRLTSWAF
ncbi:glutaredoxin family protein [Streptomyces cavourensis]